MSDNIQKYSNLIYVALFQIIKGDNEECPRVRFSARPKKDVICAVTAPVEYGRIVRLSGLGNFGPADDFTGSPTE